MVKLKQCPIDRSFHHTVIHKKWTLTILRDMLRGSKRFTDYLNNNQGLTGKVLSERLKTMEDEGLIAKNVVSTTPVEIEYDLTEKGMDLQQVLFHLSMFGAKHYPEDVFESGEYDHEGSVDTFGEGFLIPKEELDRLKKPVISEME